MTLHMTRATWGEVNFSSSKCHIPSRHEKRANLFWITVWWWWWGGGIVGAS